MAISGQKFGDFQACFARDVQVVLALGSAARQSRTPGDLRRSFDVFFLRMDQAQ